MDVCLRATCQTWRARRGPSQKPFWQGRQLRRVSKSLAPQKECEIEGWYILLKKRVKKEEGLIISSHPTLLVIDGVFKTVSQWLSRVFKRQLHEKNEFSEICC